MNVLNLQGTNAHAILASKPAMSHGETLLHMSQPAWQRKAHWFTPSRPHALLGSAFPQSQVGRVLFSCDLSTPRLGYLREHQVSGRALFPGAAMCETAIAGVHMLRAGAELPYSPTGTHTSPETKSTAALTGVTIPAALVLPPMQPVASSNLMGMPAGKPMAQSQATIMVALDVRGGTLSIQSGSGASHLTAACQQLPAIAVHVGDSPGLASKIEASPQLLQALGMTSPLDVPDTTFPGSFNSSRHQVQQLPTAVALLDQPTAPQQGATYHTHPAVLDCCTQAGSAFRTPSSDSAQDATVRVPAGLAVFTGHQTQPQVMPSMAALATFKGLENDGTAISDYGLLGLRSQQNPSELTQPPTNGPVGYIAGMMFKPVGPSRVSAAQVVGLRSQDGAQAVDRPLEGLYGVAWEAQVPVINPTAMPSGSSDKPSHVGLRISRPGMLWTHGQVRVAIPYSQNSLAGTITSFCKGLMFVQHVTAPRTASSGSHRGNVSNEVILQQQSQLDGVSRHSMAGVEAAAAAALMKVAAQEYRMLSWHNHTTAHATPAIQMVGRTPSDGAPSIQSVASVCSVPHLSSHSPIETCSHDLAGLEAGFQAGRVLVTGGLGEIGSLAGQWVAAAHPHCGLQLLGRSGRSTHPPTLLQSAQACITLTRCDVASAEEAVAIAGPSGMGQDSQTPLIAGGRAPSASSAANRPAVMQPIVGIVHAGGLLQDALLVKQTPTAFRGVLAPKLGGSLQLGAATAAAPLAASINFSSLAGLLGTAGQGNYAAANAALDAHTACRAAAGAPTLSLQWGPWATGMAAAAPRLIAGFQQAGLGVVQPAAGLAALAQALGTIHLGNCPVPTLVAAPFIFSRICALDMPFTPLFDPWRPVQTSPAPIQAPATVRISEQHGPAGVQSNAAGISPVAGGFGSAADVAQEVRQIITRTLGKSVEDTEPLMEAGLDSMGAVELRTALANTFSLDLPATITFDFPTTAALAAYVASQASPSQTTHGAMTFPQTAVNFLQASNMDGLVSRDVSDGLMVTPQQVQGQLQQAVQSMLGGPIGADQPLMEAGLDSLGALELRDTISRQFSIELPATVMFDYPSIAALAGFIAGQIIFTHPAPTLNPFTTAWPHRALQPSRPSSHALQQPTHSAAAFVVGAGSCYPTAPAGLESFWGALTGSRDVQSLVPYSRWDVDAVYAPDPGPGRMTIYARFGGFCRDVDLFDAGLFRMAPTEAASVDPQQRLLMEQALLAQAEASLVLGRPQSPATGGPSPLRAWAYAGQAGGLMCLNQA